MFRSANSISLLPHDIELTNPRKQSTQAHASKATLTWLFIHLPFGQNLLDGQPMEVLWSFTMNSPLFTSCCIWSSNIMYTYYIESIFVLWLHHLTRKLLLRDAILFQRDVSLIILPFPRCFLWFECGFKASGPVPRVYTIIANPSSNQILNQGLQSTEFSSKEFAGMENIIQGWYGYVGNITHIWIYILRTP